MTTGKVTKAHKIQAGIGPGFLNEVFGGKSFMHCLNEILKNARDWDAKSIRISTGDHNRLIVVDDGCGMSADNRESFLWVYKQMKRLKHQAGKFCTGTKQMLFSQAESVTVRSVSKEDPGFVYIFSFTAEEYERLALSSGMLNAKRVKKTATSWPYDHPTGTELVYVLRQPNRRGIYRGDKLAEELSARLPLMYKGIVSVDGNELPDKDVIGEVFIWSTSHPQLGDVSLEIYRPRKKRNEEDLRITGAEIGEAPFSNLVRVLGDLRDMVPPVFRMSEVCGTASASYLKEHANEDRFTVKPEVADDPRTRHLLRLLQNVAAEVMRALQIRLQGDSDENVEVHLEELRTKLRRRYGKEEAEGPGPKPPGTGPSPGPNNPRSAIRLRVAGDGEFEVREEVVITASISSSINRTHADLAWLTGHSNCVKPTQTAKGMSLVADELGQGTVRVNIPGTIHTQATSFMIVPQRVFRLSAGHLRIGVSDEIVIRGINVDKLQGNLRWSLQGPGEIIDDGARVTYKAPSVPTREQVTIIGYDSSDPGVRDTCDISVVGQVDTWVVRGVVFTSETYQSDAVDYAKPVTMLLGDSPHKIIFNRDAPGFEHHLVEGNLLSFLTMAIAQEFARFQAFELAGVRAEDLDPRDVPTFLRDIMNSSYEVYQEIVAGK